MVFIRTGPQVRVGFKGLLKFTVYGEVVLLWRAL